MVQLTEISNVAYVAWRKGELTRAEEILTSEIERNSNPSHYHLANRAFVQARLRQWNGALDDAQAVTCIFILLVTFANLDCLSRFPSVHRSLPSLQKVLHSLVRKGTTPQ